MSIQQDLVFEPSPFRVNSWVAELSSMRYTIYQSLSGYVVHHVRLTPDVTGSTLAPERLRHFFASFDEARAACEEHYVDKFKVSPKTT